jgi:hypothetical protein
MASTWVSELFDSVRVTLCVEIGLYETRDLEDRIVMFCPEPLPVIVMLINPVSEHGIEQNTNIEPRFKVTLLPQINPGRL